MVAKVLSMGNPRRSLLAFVLVLGMTASHSALALGETFKFYGRVTDALGRPLAGSNVGDGEGRNVVTDEDGNYSIQEYALTGRWELFAFRADTDRATKTQSVLLPRGDRRVDFQLLYRASLAVVPRELLAVPAEARLEARVFGPLEDQCVSVFDQRTNGYLPLRHESTDGGLNLFVGTLSVPSDTRSGRHRLEASSRDCKSGTLLSMPGSTSYLVWTDKQPPTGRIAEPKEGHGYLQKEDKGPRSDHQTTVFGETTVRVTAEDDREIVRVFISAVDSEGSIVDWCTPHLPQGASSIDVSCTLALTWFGRATIRAEILDGDLSNQHANLTLLELPIFIGPYVL